MIINTKTISGVTNQQYSHETVQQHSQGQNGTPQLQRKRKANVFRCIKLSNYERYEIRLPTTVNTIHIYLLLLLCC